MVNLKIKDKDYNLRLTTRGCVNIENRIGKNPLTVFMETQGNAMPKISELMVILHECLIPMNHDIDLDDVYDLYDEYCTNGGNIATLLEILIKVFTDSGFIPKQKDKKAKN